MAPVVEQLESHFPAPLSTHPESSAQFGSHSTHDELWSDNPTWQLKQASQ
jgi:hypothetical protein